MAHGHKTTNLIINLDRDEWILDDLSKVLVDVGAGESCYRCVGGFTSAEICVALARLLVITRAGLLSWSRSWLQLRGARRVCR